MTISITVHDLPEDTVEELRTRAAATGSSLEEYVRAHLLELARGPDAEAWVERVRARKEALGSRLARGVILPHLRADRR